MKTYIATIKAFIEIEFDDDGDMTLIDQAADEFILQIGPGYDFEVLEVIEKEYK